MTKKYHVPGYRIPKTLAGAETQGTKKPAVNRQQMETVTFATKS